MCLTHALSVCAGRNNLREAGREVWLSDAAASAVAGGRAPVVVVDLNGVCMRLFDRASRLRCG